MTRFTALAELGDHAADRLAEEIVSPTGADLTALRAAAYAEERAEATTDAAILSTVQIRVLRELEDIIAPVAAANYQLAATRFNTAATAFTAYACTTDVEAHGDALVTANPGAREAWLESPAAATELERALHPLLAAASLLPGMPHDVAVLSAATDVTTMEFQIPIATDPGKAHRRRVWNSWVHTTGRCGRWSQLHAEGVTVRATTDPVKEGRYERPADLISMTNAQGLLVQHDPHDGKPPRGWKPVASGWME